MYEVKKKLKAVLWFTARLVTSGFVGCITPIILIFQNNSIGFSLLMGFVGFLSAFFVMSLFGKLKKKDPFLDVQAYIQEQVSEAKKKIKVISSSRLKVRSVDMVMKLSRLNKVAKQIVQIVEKEPERFQAVQRFFTSYLDSAVEIIKRYTFLYSQPVRNDEIESNLKKAEDSINDLLQKFEEELLQLLSNDVMHLDVEMDHLKFTLNDHKDGPYIDVSDYLNEKEKEEVTK